MRAEARALLVVAVASALAARAEAAPPAAENTAARAAFTEGERNFQLGKFDAAIEDLRKNNPVALAAYSSLIDSHGHRDTLAHVNTMTNK